MAKAPQSNSPGAGKNGRGETSELATRIARARQDRTAAEAASSVRQNEMTGWGRGFRFAGEFVAAIIVGGVMGYVLDRVLGTSPILMIALLFVGFAAGVLNVIRAAAQMNAPAPEDGQDSVLPDSDKDDVQDV